MYESHRQPTIRVGSASDEARVLGSISSKISPLTLGFLPTGRWWVVSPGTQDGAVGRFWNLGTEQSLAIRSSPPYQQHGRPRGAAEECRTSGPTQPSAISICFLTRPQGVLCALKFEQHCHRAADNFAGTSSRGAASPRVLFLYLTPRWANCLFVLRFWEDVCRIRSLSMNYSFYPVFQVH